MYDGVASRTHGIFHFVTIHMRRTKREERMSEKEREREIQKENSSHIAQPNVQYARQLYKAHTRYSQGMAL